MIRTAIRWTVLATCVMTVGGTIGLALEEKGARTSLDLLVVIDAQLRVVEQPVDAETIRSQVPNMAAVDAFRSRYGGEWRITMDTRRGVPTLLTGGAIPLLPGPANELRWQDFEAGCFELGCLTTATVEGAARAFLTAQEALLGIPVDDLVLDPEGTTAVGRSLYLVRFQQEASGIPLSLIHI